MPKKEKIPAPGGKKDEFTNFYSKAKWRAALLKTILELAGRNLRPQGSKILSNALMKNRWIIQLDLSHNHLGDEGAIEFAQVLKVTETLYNVNLSCNEITDVGAVALAASFVPCANPTGLPSQWNRSVNYLTLSCNEIADDGFVALANAAACHPDMARIDVSRNKIGGFGMRALYRSQERNKMCSFVLYGNELGNEGVEHLCNAWKTFGGKGSHAVLNLHSNDFSLGAAQALGDLLDGNDFLQDINLSSNTLGSRGAAAIASKMVPGGRNVVRFLNLMNNRLRDEGAEEIARIIAVNSETLTKINLSSNEIEDRGGEALARAVGKNNNMTVLVLENNKFRDRTGDVFIQSIVSSQKLPKIEAAGNNFSESMKSKLNDAVKNCKSPGFSFDYGLTDDTLTMPAFLEKLTQHVSELQKIEAEKAAKKKKKKKKKGSASASSSPMASVRSTAR